MRVALALFAVLLLSCGSGKDDKNERKSTSNTPESRTPRLPGQKATTARTDNQPGANQPGANQPGTNRTGTATDSAPETRPMGAEKFTAFNYVYGNATKPYKPVEKALKAKDWATVQSASEAALEKQPWHLHAHHSLALALIAQGQPDAAVEHLDIALAGDWLRWGPTLKDDPTLSGFWDTPAGAKVAALSSAYGEEFMRRVKDGVWMLARRSTYKWPKKPGKQWSATRAEIAAYDRETQRYLRISHTRERVAGWMRSPSGEQIVWLGYWEVVMPEPVEDQRASVPIDEKSPVFRRTLVGLIDAETLRPIGETAVYREDITRIEAQYRTGDELIVSVFGPETAGEPTKRYTLDAEAGKLKKANVAPSDEPRLIMTMDKAWVARPGARGYDTAPTESGVTLTLDGADKPIAMPSDAQVTDVIRSPDKAYALVRTVADECGDPPSGSLYLVDIAQGKLDHILRGDSEFHARWLDDKTFIYADDGGRMRIYDLNEGKQVERLKNSAALAFDGIGATRGILCTR